MVSADRSWCRQRTRRAVKVARVSPTEPTAAGVRAHHRTWHGPPEKSRQIHSALRPDHVSTPGREARVAEAMERPLIDFDKNFYYEHPAVTAWSDADVRAWRRDRRVSVRDDRTPKPVRTFMEAAFPDYLVEALEASDFPRPTVIQSQGWPIIMSGHDCIGLASTGSGKTIAFTLPAIVHIIAQEYLAAGDGPIALMLAPTRELALQIKAECDKFGASSGVKNTCVYGGVPKGPQAQSVDRAAVAGGCGITSAATRPLPTYRYTLPIAPLCTSLRVAARSPARRRDCHRHARPPPRLPRRRPN